MNMPSRQHIVTFLNINIQQTQESNEPNVGNKGKIVKYGEKNKLKQHL